MLQKYAYFLILLGLISCSGDKSPNSLVDPFIGTGGHGHTFPGATAPFGMIQISPDTRLEGWDGCSGYHFSDSMIYGFSHTHLSGTGVSDYGDFLLTPQSGSLHFFRGNDTLAGYRTSFAHKNESAGPGWYSVRLDNDIEVRISSGKRSGQYSFQYPDGARYLSLDLEHRDELLDFQVIIPDSRTLLAYRRSSAWARDQRVYFASRFSQDIVRILDEQGEEQKPGEVPINSKKIALEFADEGKSELLVNVAISSVSAENALLNLDVELGKFAKHDFKKYSDSLWAIELGKIKIRGGNQSDQVKFYSALYHAMIAPNLYSDVDGRYRGRDLRVHEGEHDYYTVFSLWDTYRALHPLLTIIDPERTVNMAKTLLLQYEHGGALPVWELSANETMCMIGYHSVPVLVDAAMKGYDRFDQMKALEASINSANLNQLGLPEYSAYGFIPADKEPESVSKTLEYAYDDWCIAKLAESLGEDSIAQVYFLRSQNWKNLFDPESGFFRAKVNNGFIDPFIPEEVNFHYTEANAWHYSMYVPQDVSSWMKALGGPDELERFLDRLFSADEKTSGRMQEDITGLIGQYAHGNEPSQHMAYLYNYTSAPWKGQKIVRRILDELYSDKPDGLPGNEDCGQMSAWYIFSSLGFYPVCPGSNIYQIGSPLFDNVSMRVGEEKHMEIKSAMNSKENVYVQSVKLNGRQLDRNYILHREIMDGGILEFEMGPEPSDWGVGTKHPDSRPKEEIIPVPYLKKDARSFKKSTLVELGHLSSEVEIRYSINGGAEIIYDQPFEIFETSDLTFYAGYGEQKSRALNSRIVKIPEGRSISIRYPYANQYSAGGDDALIDGIIGGAKFATGDWQGYHGVNLEAVVDLGQEKKVNGISVNFLQDWNSWIFFPKQVQFFSSGDSLNWDLVEVRFTDVDPKEEGSLIQEFKTNRNINCRFVKILGINRGINPSWHKAPGDVCWIFADEITIH